jgi:membrane-bound serine protease (ClpP class)
LFLVLFGLLLFVLEIKVTSFGLLTAGGVVSLIFGSMILVDSTLPELQLSLSVVVPVVLGFAAVAVWLARLAVAAQRQPPVMGQASMIGEPGEALTDIAPERAGQVATRGEIWNATSGEAIPRGTRVRVTGVDRLTLVVRRD